LAILPRPSRRPLRCDVLRQCPDRMMIAATQGARKGCKFATCPASSQASSLVIPPRNLRHLAAKLAALLSESKRIAVGMGTFAFTKPNC
jgi:hypothetical protein